MRVSIGVSIGRSTPLCITRCVNIAIPCNSWIWLSRGRHKRTNFAPNGRLGQQSDWVLRNNDLATVVSFIMKTCAAFWIFVLVENPKTSIVWSFAPIREALLAINATRICISMGSFHGDTQKHLIIHGTPTWLGDLEWVSKRVSRARKDGHYLCEIWTDNNGDTKVKGKRRITSSAAYTPECPEKL